MPKPKLLLIDGFNMAFRVWHTNQKLSYKGRHTGLIYGFFKQLVSLHKEWPDHFRIVAWDGGYDRRLKESEEGVEQGIIPETYKANRRKAKEEQDAEKEAEMESAFEQIDQLKEGLELSKTLQVKVKGVEADDIIFTYAREARKWGGESVIVSSDMDFYQALDGGTMVFDAMKKERWGPERLKTEFGFEPKRWVDKGALEGEVGPTKDNIFGIDGWGPKHSCDAVREHGSLDAIVQAVLEKEAALTGKKKLYVREQNLLNSLPRLKLAYSLKSMDMIPHLPRPRVLRHLDKESMEKYFLDFGIASLLKDIWRLI